MTHPEIDPHRDRQPVPPASPRGRGRRGFALVAAAFFLLPSILFVVGVRPSEVDNRRLASFPSLHRGWAFFGAVSSWATDHLTGRTQAIHANGYVSNHVFSEPPSTNGDSGAGIGTGPGAKAAPPSGGDPLAGLPVGFTGKDGFIFLGEDVRQACAPAEPPATNDAMIDQLARAVIASGRQWVWVTVPDKTRFESQLLPQSWVGQTCAPQVWAQYPSREKAAAPGWLDLATPLKAEEQRTGTPIFLPRDTHWTDRGACVFAEQLAVTLDPALGADQSCQDTGTRTYTGDIDVLTGVTASHATVASSIARPGLSKPSVTTRNLGAPGADRTTVTNTGTSAAPVYGKRVLIYGDSFVDHSIQQLSEFFGDAVLDPKEAVAADEQQFLDDVADSQVVVFEAVERFAMAGHSPASKAALVAAIEAKLAQVGPPKP